MAEDYFEEDSNIFFQKYSNQPHTSNAKERKLTFVRKKQTFTEMWGGFCRTDQKGPYLHTSN